MIPVDVIILSYCATPAQFDNNCRCIQSLLASEPVGEVNFQVLVLESNPAWATLSFRYPFDQVSVLVPDRPFHYNHYLNLGIQATSAPWAVLANNDLVFHPGWFAAMQRIHTQHPAILSFCPFDQQSPYLSYTRYAQRDFHEGYQVPITLVGWCVVVRREVFNILGPFDERFDLYFQDNDFARTLQAHGVRHAMVPASFVHHLGGYTTGQADASGTAKYQEGKRLYEEKWGKGGGWQHRWRRLIHFLKRSLLQKAMR